MKTRFERVYEALGGDKRLKLESERDYWSFLKELTKLQPKEVQADVNFKNPVTVIIKKADARD